MSRAMLGVQSVLAALVAMGCFDVHSVTTGPPMFDDFEDGNLQPTDPTFSVWACGKSPVSTDHNYSCSIDNSGYQSSHSLYVQAAIDDPPGDGKQQHGGAYLATVATMSEDVRQFSHLLFAAKLDATALPAASEPTLSVQLACKLAHLEGESQADTIFVTHSAGSFSTNDWRVWSLALGAFTVPAEMPKDIVGGTPGCLEFLDTIRFFVDADLPDGGAGSLVLHLDNVELE